MASYNPEFDDALDKVNAIHEAGHAIMTLLTGEALGFMELKHPSEDGWGQGRSARRGPALTPENEVLIKFAGVGAELIYRNMGSAWSYLFRDVGKLDWEKAQPYLRKIEGNRKAVLKNLKSKVIQMLKENWDWVLAVAKKLREKRRLSGAEVEALAPQSSQLLMAHSLGNQIL